VYFKNKTLTSVRFFFPFYFDLRLDFFKNYVEMNRPVVFKGLAKRSPAFELFTDEFLKSFTGADEVNVTAEPHKKEIRNSNPFMMSFKAFVDRYHNESLYMVNPLPVPLQ